MLGVFLLPTFTRLGHECQDFFSPSNGMYVHTDYTSVYKLDLGLYILSSNRDLGGMESEPM